MSYDSFQLTAS